jgi:hypothetical protein
MDNFPKQRLSTVVCIASMVVAPVENVARRDKFFITLVSNIKPSEGVPTLNEVLRLIARVGGFLGRKGDGDPGVKTIWQGIQEVRVAAQTIKALPTSPSN